MSTLARFFADEAGAELAEYAVAVALLVAVAVIVYNTLGASIADRNNGNGADVRNVPREFTPG